MLKARSIMTYRLYIAFKVLRNVSLSKCNKLRRDFNYATESAS